SAAPTANADPETGAEDSGPTAVAVLATDTPAPDTGEPPTVTAVTQPANGAVTLSGGVVRFAPAPDFNGVTSFTYTVSDGNSGTATATVVVTVTPVDDAPMVTAGGVAVYTENAPPVAVAPGLTLSDVDSAILTGGTVAITGGFAPGQDGLAFTPVGAITGSYDPTAGALTPTGSAPGADY